MQWLQKIVLARNCKISLSRQCWCFQQMLYSCHDEAINTDQTNLCVRWDHCFRWTESSMSCKSTFIGSDYLFLSILRRYCLNVWKQILSNWNILFPWNMLCLHMIYVNRFFLNGNIASVSGLKICDLFFRHNMPSTHRMIESTESNNNNTNTNIMLH